MQSKIYEDAHENWHISTDKRDKTPLSGAEGPRKPRRRFVSTLFDYVSQDGVFTFHSFCRRSYV
jgi:hypothetical protein